MREYKLKIDHNHLRVFAGRYPSAGAFYIYVFINRRLINNMQSPLEIEVLKWNDNTGTITRLEEQTTLVDDFVSDKYLTKIDPMKKKQRKRVRGERQYLHHYITKPPNDGWMTDDFVYKPANPQPTKNFYMDKVNMFKPKD